MTKHPGGRGRKAPNKHETITISLPPHLKALLDTWTTPELSRSGVVGQLIQARADTLAVKVSTAPAVTAPHADAKPDKAPARAEVAESAAPASAGPSRPSGEELKWSGADSSGLSTAQAKILGALGSGAALVRNGPRGQWSLCWPDGRVRSAGNPSVQALKRAGLLVSD